MAIDPEDDEKNIRNFADCYWRTGDAVIALSESKLKLPMTETPANYAAQLLARKDVQDLLILMGDGTDTVDGAVARLSAMRRMAARKGDFRSMKEIEMEIAKLRGHLREPEKKDSVERFALADIARILAFTLASNRTLAPPPEQPEPIDVTPAN